MKKAYRTEKYKAYAKKKAEKRLKRKRKKNRRKGQAEGIRHVFRAHSHTKKSRKLTVPLCFSIIENAEETLKFFHEMYLLFKNNREVQLDLSDVKKITPDALLYMLSLFDIFKQQRMLSVSGNSPKDYTCRRLLIESEFYDYVTTRQKIKHSDDKILSIRSHSLVEGEIAEQVINFALKHLGKERSVISRSIYSIILECMGNTREHAYDGTGDETLIAKRKYSPKWWLMAVYNENTSNVSFTILDNGKGIPNTVRKKFFEKIFRIFKKTDYQLIQSALNGDFRTRTKNRWRGKGLPNIYQTFQKEHVSNLVIISNKAYLNYEHSIFKDLDIPFQGTLLSWDFV